MELLARQPRHTVWGGVLLVACLPLLAGAQENLQPYELVWRQDLDRRLGREVIASPEHCWAASLDRKVACFRLKDGERLWQHRPKAGVQAGLGGGLGGIVGISDFPRGRLFCLDAATGKERWIAPAGEAWTPPLVADDAVFAATLNGFVSARDLETGNVLWQRKGRGLIRAALSLHDSLLIVPTVSDTLYALNRATGAVVWTACPFGPLYGPPVACGDGHWTISYDGVLMEWNLATGSGAVRKRLEGRFRAGLAVADDRLILLSAGGELRVLDASQLAVQWHQTLLSATDLPPVVRGEWVWVGLRDGTLRAFRISDGRLMVKFSVGAPIATPVLCAGDSLLLVGSATGELSAYRRCDRVQVMSVAADSVQRGAAGPTADEPWTEARRPMFTYERRTLPEAPALVSAPAPRSILDPLRPRLNGSGRLWAGCWIAGTALALWLQHEADDAYDRYETLGDPARRADAFDDAERYDRGALGAWITAEFFFFLTVKNWIDRDAEEQR